MDQKRLFHGSDFSFGAGRAGGATGARDFEKGIGRAVRCTSASGALDPADLALRLIDRRSGLSLALSTLIKKRAVARPFYLAVQSRIYATSNTSCS